ncbi:MAG: T9SS type A sorting domain-containing protein, partial [Saprospiraceae bacterium]|nr:T9SS type A sorting domain-containing protein [Saprospiraceae bacterium]
HDCNTGYSEGLAVNGNVDGFTIINNTLTNITNIGIDAIGGEGTATASDQARNGLIMDNDVQNCKSPYAPAAGIYVDGGANITIESNLVTGCQWGIEVGCENSGLTATNITVKNNFLYNNDDAAIAVGGYNYPSTGRVVNCTIRNNTALSNDASPAAPDGSTGQLAITATDTVEIFNNIFYKTNGDATMISVETGSTGLSLNYNLYYSTGSVEFFYEDMTLDSLEEFQLVTGQGANSIFADPKFQSAVGGVNFHLANATSPAINAGDPNTSISPGELDGYKDDNRINDDTIDIGADEFGSILPVKYLKPFEAALDQGQVKLSWHTAEEINSDHFQVERTRDLSGWEIVGNVAARGSSFAYELTDVGPLTGVSYYRLRQVDIDGQFELSAVQSIRNTGRQMMIYPNPASGVLRISGVEEVRSIKLLDLYGRILRTWIDVDPNTTLPISDLSAGSYVVRIQTGNGVHSQKVIIE